MARSADSQRHQRRIVKGFGTAAEGGHTLLDEMEQRADAFRTFRLEYGLQPFGAEHLRLLVFRLDEAVGVEEEQVTGSQLDTRLVHARHTGDGHAGRSEGNDAGRSTQDELGIVSSVDVSEDPAVGLEDAEEEREVDASWRVLIELAIETIGQPGEIRLVRKAGAQRRLDVGHQERRAHALARHIADEQSQPAVGQYEVVEEVSADFGPGERRSSAGPDRRTRRQHLGLDETRQLELAASAW